MESVRDLAYTPVWLLDFEVKPGGKAIQKVPGGWNAFAYVLDGEALFGEEKMVVKQYHNVIFGHVGDTVLVEVDVDAKENARFGKSGLKERLPTC